MQIRIKRTHPNAIIPAHQTPGAAGFDLALPEDLTVPARGLAKVGIGLVFEIPLGYFLQISSRSSSPLKKGITLENGIAVVDSDYRGPSDEVFLLVRNLRDEEVMLKVGDRIAQGLILPVMRADFLEVVEMDAPDRGGHGSTGT